MNRQRGQQQRGNFQREPSDSAFPGAIKKNMYVLAVMRDNKTWHIAKIMEIRHEDP